VYDDKNTLKGILEVQNNPKMAREKQKKKTAHNFVFRNSYLTYFQGCRQYENTELKIEVDSGERKV
jgi:hypothetical protein